MKNMNTSTTGKLLIGISIVLSVLSFVSMTVPLIGKGVGTIFGIIHYRDSIMDLRWEKDCCIIDNKDIDL